MTLFKILIFLIGDALCFPNAPAQNRRPTMQQVHNELQNDLQKEIKVFHFPIRTEFKPILKPQRPAAIKIQRFSNKQAINNRQPFNFDIAGDKPINTVLNEYEFFNFYQQMLQKEW